MVCQSKPRLLEQTVKGPQGSGLPSLAHQPSLPFPDHRLCALSLFSLHCDSSPALSILGCSFSSAGRAGYCLLCVSPCSHHAALPWCGHWVYLSVSTSRVSGRGWIQHLYEDRLLGDSILSLGREQGHSTGELLSRGIFMHESLTRAGL